MDDGRGSPPPTEPDVPPRSARRRWPVVAAAVLVLGGAGLIGASALDHREEPALVTAAAASTPAAGGALGSTDGSSSTRGSKAVPAIPGPSPTAVSSTAGGASQETAAPAPQPVPVRVSIPSIGVDSSLLQLGLAADGSIAVPQPGPDYDSAAWFTGSPRPGAAGPSVIEGHVDSAGSGPSVFARLGELAVGDRVAVARADGSSVTFAVTGAQRYAKDDFPTLAVYGNTDDAQLRLITCGGSFDAATGHYRDNTVVFARQV